MTHLDRRAEVVADSAAAHPMFAVAAADSDTPLLDLAAVLPEGLDPVDPAAVGRQVDFLAFLTERAAAGASDPARRLAALRRVLAEEEGFAGDEVDYDHPHNSYIERVLERRCGLPITLSVLYQAVGERLGWPLAGVNLPGHFLVGYWAAERLWLVDPFHGGAAVDVARCLELAGAARADTAYALERPAPPHLVVRRMLMNLEGSFLRRGDLASLRNVAQKALLLDPTVAGLFLHLGQVHHRLGDHRQALACWHSYLATEPNAPDRSLLEAEIVRLETELDNP